MHAVAQDHELLYQIHLHETESEPEEIEWGKFDESPTHSLKRIGVLGPRMVAVHCVWIDDHDIHHMRDLGCGVAHCPTSNMKLGSGIAPVSALLAQGVNLALGTDGAASNNRLDLFAEMRLTTLLAKVATGNPAAMPAQATLRAATLGGAEALGLDARIGSLVPGKQADFVAVDLAGVNAVPCYDPVSHLLYAVGREAVTDVWVGGTRVVDGRILVTADEHAIVARARLWQERLQ
jgi:5-methylthioadenosine/S-adenosylhomocysteine deaminase